MDDYKYQLWEYLADELNVIALDGQIEEIIRLALQAALGEDAPKSTNSKNQK